MRLAGTIYAAHANSWSNNTNYKQRQQKYGREQSSYSARVNWENPIRPLELRISYDDYIHSTPNFRMYNSFICTQIAAWLLCAMQDITVYILLVPPFIIQSFRYKTVGRAYVVKHTGVLISPSPDQEGNKLGRMPETRAISTTSRRELSSSFFFSARQDAEGNSRHSDRNISLFPSWLG